MWQAPEGHISIGSGGVSTPTSPISGPSFRAGTVAMSSMMSPKKEEGPYSFRPEKTKKASRFIRASPCGTRYNLLHSENMNLEACYVTLPMNWDTFTAGTWNTPTENGVRIARA